jgi:hypothetical protein
MSTHTLKRGDRVRVVTDLFRPFIEPGDKGTIRSGPEAVVGGGHSYVVALDKDAPVASLGHVFLAEQIELAPL